MSIDFELTWGVIHKIGYENNAKAVQPVVIPKLPELFKKYQFSATFGVVELIFYNDIKSVQYDKLFRNCKNRFLERIPKFELYE